VAGKEVRCQSALPDLVWRVARGCAAKLKQRLLIIKTAVCELWVGQSIQRQEIMRIVVTTKRMTSEAHSHERDPRHSAPADRRRRQAGRPVAHGAARPASRPHMPRAPQGKDLPRLVAVAMQAVRETGAEERGLLPVPEGPVAATKWLCGRRAANSSIIASRSK
jgi:hypothetical protein